MRTLFTVLAIAALGSLGGAAAASPGDAAHLSFRDANGRLRSARLADIDALLAECGSNPSAPTTTRGPDVTVTVGDNAQTLRSVAGGDDVFLVAAGRGTLVTEGLWCRLTGDVYAALGAARIAPANRGPWLAFIAAFGGIGLAVALVASWGGGGVGPAPKLETASDPDH